MRAGVIVQSLSTKPQASNLKPSPPQMNADGLGLGTRLSEAYPAAQMAGLEEKDGWTGVFLSRASTQTNHPDTFSFLYDRVSQHIHRSV